LSATADPGDCLDAAAERLYAAEAETYAARRPRSRAGDGAAGLVDGVPLHWMRDWPMPFPMLVERAAGARLVDVDGNAVTDFCLGDTGAMFGHAPAPIVRALAASAERGLTTMLPSADAERVGRLLAARFGLPLWQVATTASDANRFAIRVARAVTGRRRILVFDGCYHGAVDDTLVDLVGGRTVPRDGLIGQAADLSAATVAVPFNDTAALAAALAAGDVACVVAEPVMTNCSMILPAPGFHAALRRLTRAAGTLLLVDETHTISTGLGGYTAAHGLEPDIFVAGKPLAGGVPASVWGVTADVAARLAAARQDAGSGHSGIGTTLSGSALQLACLRACLEEVMTAEAYARMAARADIIEAGLVDAIRRRALPWHVARVGARLEVAFSSRPHADAAEARAAARPGLERAVHLALLNRGFLVTPFHNMVLVSPATTVAEAEGFVAAYGEIVDRLIEESAA
jgi:glutamate-1-semialdehyde 2,1-aminomutase